MKFAAIRAAMWFFGAWLAVMWVGGAFAGEKELEKMSNLEYYGGSALIAGIIAGFIFFKTLYDVMQESGDTT